MELFKHVVDITDTLHAVIHIMKVKIQQDIFFQYKIGIVGTKERYMKTEEVLKSPYYPSIEEVVIECFVRIEKILDANSQK